MYNIRQGPEIFALIFYENEMQISEIVLAKSIYESKQFKMSWLVIYSITNKTTVRNKEQGR